MSPTGTGDLRGGCGCEWAGVAGASSTAHRYGDSPDNEPYSGDT
jgi:hypothetical protein